MEIEEIEISDGSNQCQHHQFINIC